MCSLLYILKRFVEQGVLCYCRIPPGTQVTLDLLVSQNTIKLKARVSDVQVQEMCSLFMRCPGMSTLVYKNYQDLNGFLVTRECYE